MSAPRRLPRGLTPGGKPAQACGPPGPKPSGRGGAEGSPQVGHGHLRIPCRRCLLDGTEEVVEGPNVDARLMVCAQHGVGFPTAWGRVGRVGEQDRDWEGGAPGKPRSVLKAGASQVAGRWREGEKMASLAGGGALGPKGSGRGEGSFNRPHP